MRMDDCVQLLPKVLKPTIGGGVCDRQNGRYGSNGEELNVRKSSPLYPAIRASTRRAECLVVAGVQKPAQQATLEMKEATN